MANPKVNTISKPSPPPTEKKPLLEDIPKKKFPIWVFIVIGVQVVALAGGFVLFKTMRSKREQQLELAKASEKKAKPLYLPAYSLAPFIVNLDANSTASKVLTVEMSLELEENSIRPELDEKTPAIRDEVMMLLSSKTSSELDSPEKMRSLQNEILQSINRILSKGHIKSVSFSEFFVSKNQP